MAIVETGLGWYAQSDWLANQAVAVGTIVKSGGHGNNDYDDQPLPYGIASASNGMYVGTSDAGRIFCAGGNDDVYVFFTSSTWWCVSEVYNAKAYWYSERLGTSGYFSCSNSYTVNGRTYYYNSTPWNIHQYACPMYSSGPAGVAALDEYLYGGGTTTVDFAKSTVGYSVICMCKWITEYGGDVYCSPVLISSVVNNTLYTRNSSTPSVNATEHAFQGMTFYMRKAPLDILDGTESINSSYPYVNLSGVAQTNDTIFTAIAAQSGLGVGHPPQDVDPYSGGGTSGPSDGQGTFDDSSDTIDDSTIPSYSFAASGFSRIYNPTLAQLNSLAQYMWTDTTFLQTVINHLKQILENPIDAVITVSMLPVSIPHGTSEEVKVMYIPTGVSMPPATTQFVDVDCGNLFIDEYYGSALDYNPYTKVSIFLPFIGMVDLDTDEVMNKTIFLKYRVDIVSGSCVAKIFVGDAQDNSCLYQFTGDCSIAMPMNSADFSGYRAAFISAAKAVTMGVAAAGGGIAAAAEASRITSELTGGFEGQSEEGRSRYEQAVRNVASDVKSSATPVSFGDSAKSNAVNTVGEVTSGKLQIQHASGFGGNSGMLGIRRPYVIIKRPNMCNPETYGKYNGRPCEMYLSLATLSGYTEVQNIQLTGFSATNPELGEIASLLRGGVIL